jgi:predicted transposase YdaD
MLPEILKESWVYQETIEEGKKAGLEEGKKAGLEEGKKQDLIQFVEIRFPTLLVQAKWAMEQKMSVQQIQTMLNKLYQANTIEEATTALQVHETER